MRFRPLVEGDKDTVLAIAKNTWGGHDHLPKMFEEWLSDDSCHPICVEVNGRIASLGCVRLIEEGRTAWLEGLRTQQDFQEKGYARVITNHLKSLAKGLGAERMRLTVSLENPTSVHLAASIGMIQMQTLAANWFGPLYPLAKETRGGRLRSLEPSEAMRVIVENPNLVPHNVLIYHWYALDASEGAAFKMADVSFSTAESEGSVIGLSLGFQRMDGEDHEWCMTVYPTNESALVWLVSDQIEKGIQHDSNTFMIMYPKVYDRFTEQIESLRKPGHALTLALFEGTMT
jgi:hypothetical protein